jgi:ABC-2 type transport system permease protein
LIRDPTELLTRAVQPILWLVVFGQIFSRVRGIPTGNVSYQTFMAPGILSQSVLFSAIFYGIAVIWERDLGIVHKLLVSPAYRSALVFGKSMAAGLRGIFQAVVIYLLAFFMNIGVAVNAGAIILVIAAVIIGSAIFSTFSLIIACLVKTRERFMGIGQLLTMPLFFASNAIYPLELMPNWLKVLAGFNPLTYLVDALRGTMIAGGESVFGLVLDFSVLWIVYLFFLVIAALLYPVLVE